VSLEYNKPLDKPLGKIQFKETIMKKRLRCLGLLLFVFIFTVASPANAGILEKQSGLKYEDIEIGSGDTAGVGNIAVIHFSGWIDDNGKKGTQFFNSRDRGEPISFKVGTDKVIEGWNIGVTGMKAGGKRRLMIPSKLAYGSEGSGDVIPPDAALIFEIELLEVK
jgi:peptidylprolyl isomerase